MSNHTTHHKKIENNLPMRILRILRREPGYQFPPVLFAEITLGDENLHEHSIDQFAAAVMVLNAQEMIRENMDGDIRISHHGKRAVDSFIAMMN